MPDPIELDSIDALGAGAVGEPGQRAFYIQARSESAQLTVLVEKEQVALLAAEAVAFLDRIADQYPEDLIVLPELWRVGFNHFDQYDAVAESLHGPTVQTFARIASGIFSISGTLNTPDATRTISPPQIKSQLQKQKLMVRRAMRAVPSSHWPSLAPRTNSVLSDTVGCGQRMPVAWPEPTPITMSATVTSRPPCAQPMGLPWRGSSGRPTRRRSPSALYQSGPIRLTNSSVTSSLRKPSGMSLSVMSPIHPLMPRIAGGPL